MFISPRATSSDNGLRIAISGKGGVGKTTVCAVWAQLFAEQGFDVLAVDADPDTSLASAFAVPEEASPTPLIRMKSMIAERTGTTKEALGAYFKLNPRVSDLPDQYSLELNELLGAEGGWGRLRLLVLGGIAEAGAGCACPESTFLKAMLTHALLHRREVILVDLPAGVEFMGRASVQGIDALVTVVEPGGRSISTALNICRMARQLGVGYTAAVLNKLAEPSEQETVAAQLGELELLGAIPYRQSIQGADLARQSAYRSSPELVETLREAGRRLGEKIGQIARAV